MEFLIRIKDGVPFEHPIHVNNFVSAFPGVDINNLPHEYAYFIREPHNIQLSPFQKVNSEYVKINDNTWTDRYYLVDVSPEEAEQIRASLEINIQIIKDNYKKLAQEAYDKTNNQDDRKKLEDYFIHLDNYRVTDYTNIDVPKPYILDAGGNLYKAGN